MSSLWNSSSSPNLRLWRHVKRVKDFTRVLKVTCISICSNLVSNVITKGRDSGGTETADIQERVARSKMPGHLPSKEMCLNLTLPIPWLKICSFHNYKNVNVFCLSHVWCFVMAGQAEHKGPCSALSQGQFHWDTASRIQTCLCCLILCLSFHVTVPLFSYQT